MTRRAVVLLVAALAACPGRDEATPCNDDDDCPLAESCVDGRCGPSTGDDPPRDDGGRAPDAGRPADGGVVVDEDGGAALDGGVVVDGGALDGGGALDDAGAPLDGGGDAPDAGGALDGGGALVDAGCGGIGALVESFTDGGLDSAFGDAYVYGTGMTASSSDGVLSFTPTVVTDAWAVWFAHAGYDLRGDDVVVGVDQVMSPSSTETGLELRADRAEWRTRLAMYVLGGDLHVEHRVDGGVVMLEALPYDEDAHRWWRVRERAGTTTFAAAATVDGGWVELGETATPAFAPLVFPALAAGADDAFVGGAPARFTGVNEGRTPTPVCPTSSLVEPFDALTAARWRPYVETGACSFDAAGTLVIAATTPARCFLTSQRAFDVSTTPIVFDVGGVAGASLSTWTAQAGLAQGERYALFYVEGDKSFGVLTYDGANAATLGFGTWSDAAHRFLRIRPTPNGLAYDASADGDDWTALGGSSAPFDRARVVVSLRLIADVDVGDVEARLGGVNAP